MVRPSLRALVRAATRLCTVLRTPTCWNPMLRAWPAPSPAGVWRVNNGLLLWFSVARAAEDKWKWAAAQHLPAWCLAGLWMSHPTSSSIPLTQPANLTPSPASQSPGQPHCQSGQSEPRILPTTASGSERASRSQRGRRISLPAQVAMRLDPEPGTASGPPALVRGPEGADGADSGEDDQEMTNGFSGPGTSNASLLKAV